MFSKVKRIFQVLGPSSRHTVRKNLQTTSVENYQTDISSYTVSDSKFKRPFNFETKVHIISGLLVLLD